MERVKLGLLCCHSSPSQAWVICASFRGPLSLKAPSFQKPSRTVRYRMPFSNGPAGRVSRRSRRPRSRWGRGDRCVGHGFVRSPSIFQSPGSRCTPLPLHVEMVYLQLQAVAHRRLYGHVGYRTIRKSCTVEEGPIPSLRHLCQCPNRDTTRRNRISFPHLGV